MTNNNEKTQNTVSRNEQVPESTKPKDTQAHPKKKKRKRLNAWLGLLIKLAVIATLVYAASFFISVKFVHSNEMFPSLRDGDVVITTNLISYSFNDIVLYEVTGDNGNKEQHLGRVVSLGGNEVELDEYGNLKVNGSIIITNDFYDTYDIGKIEYPLMLGADELYILQDYRPELSDSRVFGAIPSKAVIGKVIFNFRIRGF